MRVNKKEKPPGQDRKLESFTQLQLKEVLAKKGSWTPEKEGSPDNKTPNKGKRKRTCSQTPPNKRKGQQEPRKSMTPAIKRKKTGAGAKREETPALEIPETLTPVRKMLHQARKVTEKINKLEEKQVKIDSG